MSKQIKQFSDLKDSQLLYDKNPPALGFFLIATVTVAIIATVIWSVYAPKTYVVKGNGTVIKIAELP